MSFLFFSLLSLTDDPPPDGEGFGLLLIAFFEFQSQRFNFVD